MIFTKTLRQKQGENYKANVKPWEKKINVNAYQKINF